MILPCPLRCPVTPPLPAIAQPGNKIEKERPVLEIEDVFPPPMSSLWHKRAPHANGGESRGRPVCQEELTSGFSLHRFNFCSHDTVREDVLLTLTPC